MGDLKDAIRSVAPCLATALGSVAGGPLLGAALGQLSTILIGRSDGTEGEIAAAVAQGLSGDQIVALKAGEQQFQLDMARIAQEGEAAALADVANARQQTVALATAGSSIAWGAPVISTIVTIGFFLCIFMVFFRGDDLPDNLTSLVNYLFGALTSGFIGVTQYWLGSSAGSKRAGDAVREIAVNQSRKS